MKSKKFWVGVLVLAGSAAAACCIGRYPMTARELWEIFSGAGADTVRGDVLLKIRLPRILFAGMSGAALAVAGLVYQELFQNPLVSPDILGVSGGACVGAVGAILAGGTAFAVQASALTFGIATVLFTAALSVLIGRKSMMSLILSGIVVKALMDAALMACKYLADPSRQLPSIDYWMMGSFHTVKWAEVKMVLPFFAVSLLALWLLRWKLQVISMGEEEAGSLGIPVGAVKMTGILAATVMVASSVSVSGIVVWTGLIVPHMVRIFSGESLMKNFGLCGCGGAVFMIWMDTLARSLTSAEIPVSILTSAAGAAFLIAILARRKRKGGAAY